VVNDVGSGAKVNNVDIALAVILSRQGRHPDHDGEYKNTEQQTGVVRKFFATH